MPSCFFSTFSTSVTHGRLAKLFTNSRRGKRRARACEWRKQICVSMYINALFRRPQSNPLQISSNAHVMSGSFSLTCEATLVQSPRKGRAISWPTLIGRSRSRACALRAVGVPKKNPFLPIRQLWLAVAACNSCLLWRCTR